MAYLNKVLLIGNIGKDPEIRMTQSGQKQVKFSLATTDKYKDKNTGEIKETTEWHNIVLWGAGAETFDNMNLLKGISLHIEGKLSYRSWDDQSGQKRYTTEIICDRFQVLTPRRDAYASTGVKQYGNSDQGKSRSGDDLPF